VLPFVARILPGAIDAGVLVTIAVGLAAAVRAARPLDESILTRLRGVALALVISAPAIVAVAAVALPLGTFQIESLSAAQAGVPWGWSVFSSVTACLALPAAIISLLLLPLPPKSGNTALVIDRVRLFIGASLITIVFLGGFRLPFFFGDPLLASPLIRLAAAVLFVVKAIAVVVVGSRLRRAVSNVTALAISAAVCAVLAAGSATVALLFPEAALPGQVVGPVSLTVALIVAGFGLYEARRGGRSEYQVRLPLFS
jgi:NADH:ubiquinone oxidoreductase subunit H